MKKYAYIICLFFGLLGCEPEQVSSIPNYTVYLERTLNLEAQELLAPGGSKTFTTPSKQTDALGYGGIIVYHSSYEQGQFYAYDMACPNEISRTVRVTPYNAIQVKCEKCGAVFSLETGNCVEGEAKEGLKIYQAIASYTAAGTVIRVINQNR
jgi:nitrite reductase/ring-hydroxylating ferredoxin subunit